MIISVLWRQLKILRWPLGTAWRSRSGWRRSRPGSPASRAGLVGWSRAGRPGRSCSALLSDVDARSCWQLAGQAGHRTPHRMQWLLGEAVWDADAVRNDVRR